MRTLLLLGMGPQFGLNPVKEKVNWSMGRDLLFRALEIQNANLLARSFDKVYLLTYEDRTQAKQFLGKVDANVDVLFRPKGIPLLAYGPLAVLVHNGPIRKASVCKTLELRGSVSALLCKLLYGTKILHREGYQISEVIRTVQTRSHSRPIRSRIHWILMSTYEILTCHIANAVVVESAAHRNFLLRKFAVPVRKVFVVPHWVDTKLFKPDQAVPKEKGRIVFVGRIDFVKNVLSLVEAVKKIPHAKLYLIGEGPLRKDLERKLRQDAITNVVLAGAIPHEKLPFELQKSEIFILPSFIEGGSPRALLEAMACGLPVIGSDIEGINQIIADGTNGLSCATDADSIRKMIIRLLSHRKLRAKIGANARTQVENTYAPERVLEKEARILNSLF